MRSAKRSKRRGSTSTGIRFPATAPRQDVDKFEAQALASGGFDTADVPPRYRSSYFLHIWSNGYSASYYAYAWTRMLGQDAFNTFETRGGLTRANGQRFRDLVLSRGNTLDYAEMYRNWAGHDPQIQPYLDYYGLNGGAARRLPLLRQRFQRRRPRRLPLRRSNRNGGDRPMIRQLDDRTLVSGQIAPEEVAGLAGHGVTILVNNRPDGEEPGQPQASDIEAAAAAGGHRLPLRPDHPRHRPCGCRSDAAGAARSRRRQAARLLPLGDPLGPRRCARPPRGRRFT